ncbi:hypothetical protein BKA56DRAFT_336254 [Ilyonectria sp. MPI-CAGE-AT-0026]|nr:hypothetical protein BKA56DRAFT_336254 [Ilyonectria sp. MPI-CAGE-AT-0026]
MAGLEDEFVGGRLKEVEVGGRRGTWFAVRGVVLASWRRGTLLGCWRTGHLERQQEAKEQGHELDAGRRRAQKKEECSNEVTCRRRSSSRSGSWENVRGGYAGRAPASRIRGGGSRGLRRMRRGRCVHSHHAQVCLCPCPHPQANGKAALRGGFFLLGTECGVRLEGPVGGGGGCVGEIQGQAQARECVREECVCGRDGRVVVVVVVVVVGEV